jgi:hypothetical protein
MRRIVAPLLLCLVLTPAVAWAEPSAAERETARRLLDEGNDRTKKGDLKAALESFSKAHGIMHVPSTGIALARTHLALGQLVEARDVALEVMRTPRERGEPPIFEQARAEARDIEAKVKPRIPTLRIKVTGAPPKSVTLDGAPFSKSLLDAPVAANPGHHVVVATNKDGVEAKGEIDLAEKDEKSIEVAVPEPGQGGGATQPPPPPPPPKDPEPSSGGGGGGGAKALMYGGFGLAAAGAVVGTITGVMTLSTASKVKDQCANNLCDPAARSDLDSSRSTATVSTVAFIVGGAGLALGFVGILLLPPSKPQGAFVRPAVGPATISFEGRF